MFLATKKLTAKHELRPLANVLFGVAIILFLSLTKFLLMVLQELGLFQSI